MLRPLKLGLLRASRACGTWRTVRDSGWRGRRLLILCYHGISYTDEHLWNPGLYLSPSTFRRRLQLLKDGRYEVLPLSEALERLEAGSLPPRSVAITFDDGGSNFFDVAFPILQPFGWPVTVYLPTYYCLNQLPVFDVAASYLLWKGQGQRLDLDQIIPGREAATLTAESIPRLYRDVHSVVRERRLSAVEKDGLAAELARRLGQDYDRISRSRLFHLMTPEETAFVARAGVSIELHTHRHRTPRDRTLFLREVEDNRREIAAITGVVPRHFCYPSGDFVPEFFDWLRQANVLSATTCELGLGAVGQNAFRRPRMLDTEPMSDLEFESWLTGVGAMLPSRHVGS